MLKKRTKIQLVVSSGQYETSAMLVTVSYLTPRGLLMRARQLSRKYAVYGDNWAGWINANVAIAHPRDRWGKNQIIGGRWCEPYYGWIDLQDDCLALDDIARSTCGKGVHNG